MGVMALFTFKRCFPCDIFFKKRLICVLDSYFISRYIIIKYGQVRFRVKSANYYESYGPFFNFIFYKIPACGWGWPWAGASVSYWHISSFVHTLGCLQHWQPIVGKSVPFVSMVLPVAQMENPVQHWYANTTIGKTLNARSIWLNTDLNNLPDFQIRNQMDRIYDRK